MERTCRGHLARACRRRPAFGSDSNHVSTRGQDALDTDTVAANPDAPGLALPIEQMFSNPASRLHPFDLTFATDGGCQVRMALMPDQPPGPVLMGVRHGFGGRLSGVVLKQAPRKVARRTHIEPALGVLKDIYPEWTSRRVQAPRVGLDSPVANNLAVNPPAADSLYRSSRRSRSFPPPT